MTACLSARFLLACTVTVSVFCPAAARGGNVTFSWTPSPDTSIVGYNLHYGLGSGLYTSSVAAGTNLQALVTGLTPGLVYYFAVTAYDAYGVASPCSCEVTNRLPVLPSILTQPLSQTKVLGAPVTLAVSASGDPPLSFQWMDGLAAIPGATASLLGWPQIGNANAGNYTVIVSNPWGSVTSSIAALTVVDPPSILTQPLSQTNNLGAPVTLAVSANGTPPLSFQWMNGLAAIPGATASLLSWPQIGNANAGNYSVIVSNPWGSATSGVAALTVIDPPLILTQPQSQTVTAGTAAWFSCSASGVPPLSYQWYDGGNAIAGATYLTLGWAAVATANAGAYSCMVSNALGVAASSTATLAVLATNVSTTNPLAGVAGAYNGLFYQINADGTPAVTEATAGFLGNCVVNSNGAFSAKVYVGGLSYPLAGAFTSAGSASVTIPRPGAGLSNLTAVLQLDLTRGTGQMTGSFSSATSSNVWTAPLLADLATNAFPNLTEVNFLVYPGSGANSPTTYGFASGAVANGVLSFYGTLGDTVAMSQAVPIAKDGSIPIYVSLYNNTGLLVGWTYVTGGVVTGSLTWIRPGGVLVPAGYPLGFDSVAPVSGSANY